MKQKHFIDSHKGATSLFVSLGIGSPRGRLRAKSSVDPGSLAVDSAAE